MEAWKRERRWKCAYEKANEALAVWFTHQREKGARRKLLLLFIS